MLVEILYLERVCQYFRTYNTFYGIVEYCRICSTTLAHLIKLLLQIRDFGYDTD